MEYGTDDRTILDKFAEDFCKVVDKHITYIVVSGFVSIAHGLSRSTVDIDMIIEKASKEKFEKIHDDLVESGFQCLQSSKVEDIYDYLEKGDSIRYVRSGDYAPPEMEVKFAKDELDSLQLATRQKFDFTGLDIWFSSIEMNIVFKEEYFGTDKDNEDAKHLRNIYEDKINDSYINDIKKMIRELRMREDRDDER